LAQNVVVVREVPSIKLLCCLNAEGLFCACSDIHTTKYSGGHEIFVKMIKNAGGDWQLFYLNVQRLSSSG